jgi:hypothetical protein
MRDADCLIDFDRRLHVACLRRGRFLARLMRGRDDEEARAEPGLVPAVRERPEMIVSEPIKFCRDGRDVIIDLAGVEWGRLRSEAFRDLVMRASRMRDGL